MIKMKKLLVVVLSLMMIFSLAACGGADTATTPDPVPEVVEPVDEVDVVAEAGATYFTNPIKINYADKEFVERVKLGDDMYIIDIRKADDYNAGHVVGAYNAPWGTTVLADNLASIPMDEEIYIYCYTGQTAGQTTALLSMAGFQARSVTYGFNLGVKINEGYEEIVTTEAREFGEAVTEVAPELEAMIRDFFVALKTAAIPNNIISATDVNAIVEAGDDSFQIVSIRQAEDFAKGHVPTAINIPFTAGMNDSFDMLDMDKTIIIYCYSGQTAGQTVGALRALGYDAISMKSGFGTGRTGESGYSNEGFAIEQ